MPYIIKIFLNNVITVFSKHTLINTKVSRYKSKNRTMQRMQCMTYAKIASNTMLYSIHQHFIQKYKIVCSCIFNMQL